MGKQSRWGSDNFGGEGTFSLWVKNFSKLNDCSTRYCDAVYILESLQFPSVLFPG